MDNGSRRKARSGGSAAQAQLPGTPVRDPTVHFDPTVTVARICQQTRCVLFFLSKHIYIKINFIMVEIKRIVYQTKISTKIDRTTIKNYVICDKFKFRIHHTQP